MTESNTDYLDHFPPDWTEQIYEYPEDEDHRNSQYFHVEWVFDDDEAIFVRLQGPDMGDGILVEPVTGINQSGEEFVTLPQSVDDPEEAFDRAKQLIYAMNGSIKRALGDEEFTG